MRSKLNFEICRSCIKFSVFSEIKLRILVLSFKFALLFYHSKDSQTIWNRIKTQDMKNIFKYNAENAGKKPPRLPFKPPHSQATRAFDSVYTAALALDRLLKKKGMNRYPLNIEWNNDNWAAVKFLNTIST